jgi:hypothetical protein
MCSTVMFLGSNNAGFGAKLLVLVYFGAASRA